MLIGVDSLPSTGKEHLVAASQINTWQSQSTTGFDSITYTLAIRSRKRYCNKKWSDKTTQPHVLRTITLQLSVFVENSGIFSTYPTQGTVWR